MLGLARQSGNITDLVCLCADFKPLLTQDLAMIAPFYGLSPFQKGGPKNKVPSSGFCFNCGLTGHINC